jgi:hypothetical protein
MAIHGYEECICVTTLSGRVKEWEIAGSFDTCGSSEKIQY